MIKKTKIALRQFLFMYQDDRLAKACADLIESTSDDEKFYRKELLKISNKFSNPEIQRLVHLILDNHWDDVFYEGFLVVLDSETRAILV